MVGFAALVAVVLIVVMGAKDAGWIWVPILAVLTSFIYGWMRSWHLSMMAERDGGALLSFIPVIYVTQLVTVGILFAIGRGIGLLI